MTPAPTSETPFMTVIDWRHPREKAHTKRVYAHAALSNVTRWWTRSKEPVRGILSSDAALFAHNGTRWVLLWDGKRGDDVTDKPWRRATSPEVAPSITITLSKYNSLTEDAAFLEALQGAGVANWQGYYYARELFEEGRDL